MDETPAPGSLQIKVAFSRHERGAAMRAAANRGPLLRRPVVAGSMAIVGGVGLYVVASVLQHVLHPAIPMAARAVFGIAMIVLGETEQFFLFVAGTEVQYIPKRVLYDERLEAVRGLVARHGPGARGAKLLGA
jgi:hypothetical protein